MCWITYDPTTKRRISFSKNCSKSVIFYLLKNVTLSQKIFIKFYSLVLTLKDPLSSLNNSSLNLSKETSSIIKVSGNKWVNCMSTLRLIGLIQKSHSFLIKENKASKTLYKGLMHTLKILPLKLQT